MIMCLDLFNYFGSWENNLRLLLLSQIILLIDKTTFINNWRFFNIIKNNGRIILSNNFNILTDETTINIKKKKEVEAVRHV